MWIEFDEMIDWHTCFLTSVGRALAIAQHLEEGCRRILRVAEIIEKYESRKALEELHEDVIHDLAEAMRKRCLGKVVRELDRLGQITESELAILDRGRVARNYIAHNSAILVLGYPQNQAELRREFETYERNVMDLIEADNEVSAWGYEMQELEKRPHVIFSTYPAKALEWVVAPMKGAAPPSFEKPFLGIEALKERLRLDQN